MLNPLPLYESPSQLSVYKSFLSFPLFAWSGQRVSESACCLQGFLLSCPQLRQSRLPVLSSFPLSEHER